MGGVLTVEKRFGGNTPATSNGICEYCSKGPDC